MKQVSKAIHDFTTAYRLAQSEGEIHFIAKIFIQTVPGNFQVKSDMSIAWIGTDLSEIVMALNERDWPLNFPRIFDAACNDISFQHNKGLIIRGVAPYYEEYKLMLHPHNVSTEPITVADLKSRYYY